MLVIERFGEVGDLLAESSARFGCSRGMDARIAPYVRPCASASPEVSGMAMLEDQRELVLATIEAALTGIALHPHAHCRAPEVRRYRTHSWPKPDLWTEVCGQDRGLCPTAASA